MPHKVMPDRTELGEMFNGPMSSAMRFKKWEGRERFPNPKGLRTVMGLLLPEWQRPFVWTDDQCIRFMESVWRGIPVGTYTINLRIDSPFDGYLIDGQQRMRALERYLSDEYPILGYRWSEVTEVDRRIFEMSRLWPYYETRSTDEAYLRSYYDLMNFGGTAHTPDQRAT